MYNLFTEESKVQNQQWYIQIQYTQTTHHCQWKFIFYKVCIILSLILL